MKTVTITRNEEKKFTVISGRNIYTVVAQPKWACSCPARGMCKHLRTVLASLGMGIGQSLTITPIIDSSADDGFLDGAQFDFEAARDVRSELQYIRSGREKRNCGC